MLSTRRRLGGLSDSSSRVLYGDLKLSKMTWMVEKTLIEIPN